MSLERLTDANNAAILVKLLSLEREEVHTLRLDMSMPMRDPGQSYPFSVELAIEPTVFLDDPVSFQDVRVRGDLIGTGETVAMRAVVTALAVSRCALCLEPASQALRGEMDIRFSRTPQDEDIYPIDGYAADLEKPVTDALLLELPMRFLCKPDCRGLCPVCGRNRNDGICTCADNAGQDLRR